MYGNISSNFNLGSLVRQNNNMEDVEICITFRLMVIMNKPPKLGMRNLVKR
jgi:hypothetical protein